MSQDKIAFERSVAIREGHKIHSETSYFTPRPQLDFENARHVFGEGFDRGYIAATTEANKRIAEIEGDVIRERGRANSWVNEVRLLANKLGLEEENSNGSIQDWKHINKQISQLEANNHDLREALEKIATGDARDIHKVKQCKHGKYGYEDCEACIAEYAQDALSATPAESLQAK